jgi:hypothetical protein
MQSPLKGCNITTKACQDCKQGNFSASETYLQVSLALPSNHRKEKILCDYLAIAFFPLSKWKA